MVITLVTYLDIVNLVLMVTQEEVAMNASLDISRMAVFVQVRKIEKRKRITIVHRYSVPSNKGACMVMNFQMKCHLGKPH